MRTMRFKRRVWVICLGISVLASTDAISQVTPAVAGERIRLIDEIVRTGTLECNESMLRLMNRQWTRHVVRMGLHGLGRRYSLDADWTDGNRHFEEAKKLVDNAVAADEGRNGPLLSISAQEVVRESFAPMSVPELRRIAAFFARPEGLLYWESMYEGAQCESWLKQADRYPMPMLPPEERSRRDALMNALAGGESRFLSKFEQLTEAQKREFSTLHVLLKDSFGSAMIRVARSTHAPLEVRLTALIEQHAAPLGAIVRRYKEEATR